MYFRSSHGGCHFVNFWLLLHGLRETSVVIYHKSYSYMVSMTMQNEDSTKFSSKVLFRSLLAAEYDYGSRAPPFWNTATQVRCATNGNNFSENFPSFPTLTIPTLIHYIVCTLCSLSFLASCNTFCIFPSEIRHISIVWQEYDTFLTIHNRIPVQILLGVLM